MQGNHNGIRVNALFATTAICINLGINHRHNMYIYEHKNHIKWLIKSKQPDYNKKGNR